MTCRPKRRPVALIETLEIRVLLASPLTYTGTAGADGYLLRVKSGSPTQIEVLLNNTVIDTQTTSNVSSITFNTVAADDTLTIAAGVALPVTMNGGTGNDTLTVASAVATPTFNGGTTATDHDVLNLNAGTYALATDANVNTSHMTLNVNAATATLSAIQHLEALKIGAGGSVSVTAGGLLTLYSDNLSIAPTGKLDLNDNKMAVAYPGASPFTTIQNYVLAGYSGNPDTTKTGITSTTSQNTGGNTILVVIDNVLLNSATWPTDSGNTVAPHTILGQLTFLGDFNLDGQVTPQDYTSIDANLGTAAPVGAGWFYGDGNFDGQTTPQDYSTIDSSLGLRESTPPTVSMTAPANSVTLTGSVTFSATATDNQTVASVQFLVDGKAFGAPDSTYPYSITANTATVANGTHVISAVATDMAGNVSTAAVGRTVTTANTVTDPAIVGQWSGVMTWPMVAIHQAILPNGKVFMWEGESDAGPSAKIYDPATGIFTAVPESYANIFCSGQVLMADGRVMVVGGFGDQSSGTTAVLIFNPTTNAWIQGPSMQYKRWYGTATTLPDGRVLATGGAQQTITDYVRYPEVYSPTSNSWSTLTGADWALGNYPFMTVLPDGRLIEVGSSELALPTKTLNLQTQTWTTIDPTAVPGNAAVMISPGVFMKSGTGTDSDFPGNSVNTTYVLDMNQPSPHWVQTSSMANQRAFHNQVVLPDGSVLVVGGTTKNDGTTTSAAVKAAELWNPTSQTWSTMSSQQRTRMYHSTAILLPDGRVISAGGGKDFGLEQINETNAEFFSPAYLFKGARPTITSAPSLIQYNNSFSIQTPDASSITKVSLVRLGSVTHDNNLDQRYLNLTFSQSAGGLTINAPANANLAPPGYYMLFILNANGVPSVASIMRFPAPSEDIQPPTAPTTLAAAGSIGKATLTWNASTDNIAVTGYNIYRSSTSGFTPATGNLIGTSITPGYTDNVAAGTWFYKVIARDAASNLSPASNQASAVVTADTVAPTVSITAPADTAIVSNTVTITANAADNVAVVGVQFRLDGNALGAEDTAAPYSFDWTTNVVANGPHTLTAVARDAAGNTTPSTTINVTVSNTAPTNLIAAWSFDEDGGYTAFDASGHNLVGTVTNALYVPGKFNSGLNFNGTNAWVTVPQNSLFDLTSGMTLEAWVYPVQNGAWRNVIMKQRPGGLAYAIYAYSGPDTNPSSYINRSGTDNVALGGAALPLNTWSHLAATYDNANLRQYINGTLVATKAVTGNITTSTDVLRIGGNSMWGEYFNGTIDEVRIYNRALTAAEISTDMATPINTSGFAARASSTTPISSTPSPTQPIVMPPAVFLFSTTAIPAHKDLLTDSTILS
jgi:hypothetical protein